jgi:conjugal transfer pilus assembly protein TraI
VITPAEPLLDDEIPRYPPFMKGLPATHPDKLIETQRELIGQIRETGVATPEIFEQFHLTALRRFASYAHLLPASQTHHHRGAGGLLRHAAEVALWSLQSADRVLLPGEQTPRRRRELEPRWHLAVFLAALCHDLGKPVTDLVVTSREGAEVWNPFVEDLHAWATRHRVDRYFLHWRDNRGRKHQAVSALIAERIIGAQGLAWLAEGDTDLVLWMMESINGSPSAENPIHDLVVRSDQVSVERDLRSLGVAFTGYEIGLPVERFLLDLMRRLVREGTWGINRPGARLWCIDGQLYLVWPAAGEELAALVHQEQIPGLPRTPDSLLEMLVDRSLASIPEDRGGGERYWLIAPAVLAGKIPNLRLTAIRLRDPALLSEPPPPSIPGRLLSDEDPATKAPDVPVQPGIVPDPPLPATPGRPPDPDGKPQEPPDRATSGAAARSPRWRGRRSAAGARPGSPVRQTIRRHADPCRPRRRRMPQMAGRVQWLRSGEQGDPRRVVAPRLAGARPAVALSQGDRDRGRKRREVAGRSAAAGSQSADGDRHSLRARSDRRQPPNPRSG